MDSIIIEDVQSIAIGAVVDNIIVVNNALRPLAKIPFPCRGKLLAVASGGSVGAGLRIELTHGQKKVLASSDMRIPAVFSPEDPNDIMADDWYGEPGEMLALRVVNASAGVLSIRYRILLEPLYEDWVPGMNYGPLPPDTLVQQRSQSIAANTPDLNVLDGLEFEQLPVPSMLRVLMTSSAIGLTRQLYIEQQRIAPPSAISILNRMPMDPFDETIRGVEVSENDQQILQITNGTVGAIVVFWKIKCKLMARI
jgi:hypothetical protein